MSVRSNSLARLALALAVLLCGRSVSAQPPVNGCRLSSPPGLTVIGGVLYACTADDTWTIVSTGGGATIPAGLVTFVLSGSCPTGWSEVPALDGVMLRGTLAANADVGTTGGNDSVTPIFTGTSATTSAVSGGTPAGTNGITTVTPTGTITWPVEVPLFSGTLMATHAHELPWQIASTTTIRQIAVATFGTGTSRAATAVSGTGTTNTTSAAVAKSQAVSAGTPTGTISWPAAVPTFAGDATTTTAALFTGTALGAHQHTVTATGTIGTIATIPAFLRAIFCQKT